IEEYIARYIFSRNAGRNDVRERYVPFSADMGMNQRTPNIGHIQVTEPRLDDNCRRIWNPNSKIHVTKVHPSGIVLYYVDDDRAAETLRLNNRSWRFHRCNNIDLWTVPAFHRYSAGAII